jgi:glycosyltransferase involved in cell wall biosynthesis
VTRIYNGIDLERFRFAPRSDPSLRVVAVGRLVEKKGFGDLIDAVALLRARGVDVVCDIVGTGPLEDDLRQRIAARGMDAWIQLLGPRPQKDVIELVRGARAMVAPCIVGDDGNRDGLPTVLLEAMALGTPCVATDVTGIPEIVREGETGLLVPERSPEALAEALQRLLRDASLGPRLARSARLMIEREFDIRRNTAAMRELFVEVANPTVELAR